MPERKRPPGGILKHLVAKTAVDTGDDHVDSYLSDVGPLIDGYQNDGN